MIKYIIITISLMCFACSRGTWSEPITANTYGVGCKNRKTNCVKEAYRLCPNGFMVLDAAESNDMMVTGGVIGSSIIMNSHTMKKNEFIIKCIDFETYQDVNKTPLNKKEVELEEEVDSHPDEIKVELEEESWDPTSVDSGI